MVSKVKCKNLKNLLLSGTWSQLSPKRFKKFQKIVKKLSFQGRNGHETVPFRDSRDNFMRSVF